MEQLLSIDEASQYTGLARGTIYQYIQRRCIPYIKLGKRVFFKPSELDRWINEHSHKEIKVTKEAV